MNNSMVAHAWAHGMSGRGSNLKTDGRILVSYSTIIAARIDGVIYISSDNMSITTARHLSHARWAVNHERDQIFYTPAFCWGRDPRMTHEAMILPAVDKATQHIESVLTSRARKATKIGAIQAYMARRAEIITLARRVGVSVPAMPEMQADPEALAQYEAQRAEQIAEQKRRADEERRARQLKDQEDFNAWLATGAGRCPVSYMQRGADLLTVRGDQVITSQGAQAPLDHVKRALVFYNGRRTADGTGWTPYHTNGHKIPLGIFVLDSIDEHGNVAAGCHRFTAEEIARFQSQWEEVLV